MAQLLLALVRGPVLVLALAARLGGAAVVVVLVKKDVNTAPAR